MIDSKYRHDIIRRVTACISLACGLPIQVIDQHGESIIMPDLNQQFESIPNSYDLFSCSQSEGNSGGYVYHSPLGLAYCATPIMEEGEVVGALVAGPVHTGAMDDTLFDRILADHQVDHDELSNIRARIQSIPVLTMERLHSINEILIVAARKLSGNTNAHLEKIDNSENKQVELRRQTKQNNKFDHVSGTISIYPIEKERELLDFIESGEKAGAQLVLNEILGAVFFNNVCQDAIMIRVTELVVLLSRAAIRGGADVQQIFGINYSCLNKIHAFRTVDEIAYWLSEIMDRFTNQVFNHTSTKHTEIIALAKDYVKRNYMNRITMEEVAAHIYLSPAYFSRVFKEEVGENFNFYLNQVRVDLAKKMLIIGRSSLSDISRSVGYDGQSYFTKVFKKMTGVSPNKYRESRGNRIN